MDLPANSYRAGSGLVRATGPHSGAPGAPATPAVVEAQNAHGQTIQAAHERSRAFGLVPQHAADLSQLDRPDLQELQRRNARLCAQALPVMDMLYEQLTHAQSIVLLTDASGVVLHALGDAGFLARAQQVALAPGAIWAEASKGTNAVGTVLMTERPTLVHGQDHYLRALHFLTCSAAPIFDHKGALLGVIDVSGDRRSYHPHTLALASMAARLIESQWFADKYRHSLRLHLHGSASGLGTVQEGVLALHESGQVLGANRRAIELLGGAAARPSRESVQSLFGITLSPLIDQARQRPDQPLSLTLIRQGQPAEQLQAKLSLGRLGLSGGSGTTYLDQEPITEPMPLGDEPRHGAARLPAATVTPEPFATLRDAEHKAILAAVKQCGGNLSLAARQLGIGRSTLYRKLKGQAHAPE